uniref:Uncharacterized protein n=1 Tax=Solanum lycopersicum TaxID=4081 RepID=A0A3Q7FNF8_SOLLC
MKATTIWGLKKRRGTCDLKHFLPQEASLFSVLLCKKHKYSHCAASLSCFSLIDSNSKTKKFGQFLLVLKQ